MTICIRLHQGILVDRHWHEYQYTRCENIPPLYIITVYTRAAEGEAMPAIAVVGRVDARRIEAEDVRITKIRRISPRRPSVTVDARVPQTTVSDIDVPAAN